MAKIVYVTADVQTSAPDGRPIMLRYGEHWLADDPVVLRNPGLFSDDPRTNLKFSSSQPPTDEQVFGRAVEAATREPGERRQTPPRHGQSA